MRSVNERQVINPLRANFTKWSNTLQQFVGKLPTNCLSVFDHLIRLAREGLRFLVFPLFFNYCKCCCSLYITHPNKQNNQQFNGKAILQKKKSNPCQTWSDLIYINELDNTIIFKLKSILLFWYLDDFLEKDKSGLLFQINIAWSVLTGLINWRRGLHLSHIGTIHFYWV